MVLNVAMPLKRNQINRKYRHEYTGYVHERKFFFKTHPSQYRCNYDYSHIQYRIKNTYIPPGCSQTFKNEQYAAKIRNTQNDSCPNIFYFYFFFPRKKPYQQINESQ